jgi:hypothetical protein
MPEQLTLFTPTDFVDYSLGMTSKSTRRKTPPKRKTIAPLAKDSDRPQVHKSNKLRT